MNPFTLFAIVQWAIILPIQVYCVWRSIRNWKESERELRETYENVVKARELFEAGRDFCVSVGLDPDDVPTPPTIQ